MSMDDLLWTVEEACVNAHPSPRETFLNGWLLRAAGGRTKRTNSVNPLRFGPTDPTGVIAAAEQIYGGLGQPTIFRAPSIAPLMETALDRLGYVAEAETCTLFADLTGLMPDEDDDVELAATPDDGWRGAWAALNADMPDAAVSAYWRSVDAIVLPRVFACLRRAGEPAALAYGVLDRGLLVLESVRSHPHHRRCGYAGRIVRRMKTWAKTRGAFGACLQVAADNAPARGLYHSADFTTELYRYHYRRK